MKLSIFIGFLCHITTGLALASIEDDADAVEPANELIEELLKNVRNPNITRQLTPARLPPFESGNTILKNVQLYGLDKLKRTKNARFNITDEALGIVAYLGVPFLELKCRYSYKPLGLFWINGNIAMHANDVSVKFILFLKGRSIELGDFKVHNFDGIFVTEVTGLSPFNWALKMIASKAVNDQKTELINKIETEGAEYLKNVLSQVDMGSDTALANMNAIEDTMKHKHKIVHDHNMEP